MDTFGLFCVCIYFARVQVFVFLCDGCVGGRVGVESKKEKRHFVIVVINVVIIAKIIRSSSERGKKMESMVGE